MEKAPGGVNIHNMASSHSRSLATAALPLPLPPGVVAVTGVLFAALFYAPFVNTVAVWWSDPDSGHGLLLAPLALWLAWRAGLTAGVKRQPILGMSAIVVAVLLRYAAALAAEPFVGRFAMLLALGGIVIWGWGLQQLKHWWLSVLLLALAIPLPEIVLGTLALPLQFQASELGAALLATRGIPVLLDGNVIRLPGHDLFVTEACSGLRSLTALLSIGVLLGGLMLRHPITRVVIVALSIPVAVLINGVRVFGTGYLVAFVDPALGEGFTHITEGWLLFVVSLALLGGITWVAVRIEDRVMGPAPEGSANV
jgi:exosortase